MKNLMMSVVVTGMLANGAFAASTFNGTVDDNWATPGNWVNGVPTSTSDSTLRADARIYSGTSADTNILRVAWSAYGPTEVATLTIDDTLDTYSDIRVAEGAGSTGTITVTAGATLDNSTFSSTGELGVGYGGTGVLNVAGTVLTDSMDISNWAGGNGTVNVLPGGSLTSLGRLTVGGWTGTGNLIVSAGGTVQTGDNWNSMLQPWVDSGAIRAEPGAALIVADNIGDPGKTFSAVKQTTAWNPFPAENEVITSTTPVLSWNASNAVSYDVYLGTDIDNVVSGTPASAEYLGNQAGKTYAVNSPLTVGQTYYMRVDTIEADSQLYKGDVWSFSAGPEHKTELFKDPYFQRGISVYGTGFGASVATDTFKWKESWQPPSWKLTQGGSVQNISGVAAVPLLSGSYKWENTAKSVTIGPANSTDADLVTMIDTRQETITNTTWPAIDFAQDISGQSPSFTDMSALEFNLDVRMISDEHFTDPSVSGQTFFKIGGSFQDVNPDSDGYGDLVWIALGVYRNVTSTRLDTLDFIIEGDVGPNGGQGKMIYQAGSTNFTAPGATLQGGGWVNFQGDLKPLLQDALEEAWSRGFLVDSTDASDFKLTSFGPGWESSRRSKVELQIRNLSLKAVVPAENLAGDFDLDGDVDGKDFLLWQRNPGVGNLADWQDNFGMSIPAVAAASAVPEPSTGFLLVLGMVTMLAGRRVRQLPL